MVLPVAEYSHSYGIAVTGGYVYRGSALPQLDGYYFYGDFGSGNIWSLYRDDSGQWQSSIFMKNTNLAISSFGQDEDGELYVLSYTGSISKLEPRQ